MSNFKESFSSKIVKFLFTPIFSKFSRIIKSPSAWKVPINGPVIFILSLISPAALLVKVTARISLGSVPFSTRCLIRSAITLVFPAPAPATTNTGPSVAKTASFCLSFKVSKIGMRVS